MYKNLKKWKSKILELGFSFNPCFNGRCIRTKIEPQKEYENLESFNPCFNGRCIRTKQNIIIMIQKWVSFNPCFNGRCIRTKLLIVKLYIHFCLFQSLF